MSPDTEARFMGGIWGFVLGGIVTLLIGFQVAGWTTAGTTQKLSEEAVLATRVAICVAQFMGAPNHKAKAKEFQGTDSYKRSDYIEQGGWDRMPGQEKSAWGVASGCAASLETAIKTGA